MMRLYEITSPKTYLVSTDQPYKAGAVITVAETVHPLGALLEGRLEATRPEDELSRLTSVYMYDLDGYKPSGAHVYEVVPVSKVYRHHSSWLRQLAATSTGSLGAVDHFCRAYWSGLECPEERELPWERRSSGARVVRRVGGSAIARADGSAI